MPMATQTDAPVEPRVPLSRERVLSAAVALADEEGIDAVSMRKLADRLGVKAMSLYNHVANKEDILDGMVDAVIGEIESALGGFELPGKEESWKPALRGRILTAREVMLRHPWMPGVLENRAVSLTVIRYFDSLIGILRQGGFTYDLIHHAAHALGSRALGFSQELFEESGDDEADEAMLRQVADQIPYIIEMMMEVKHDDPDSTLGWCDDQTEFLFALDLILDGLERLRDSA